MVWRLVHEEMQRRVIRRERIFRDRTHPLEVYDDVELVQRYRFRRADILWLVDMFGGVRELEYDCARSGGLWLLMQVMVALRIFAAGAFQLDVADTCGVSKPTVCRTVHRVATVLSRRLRQYVQFERPADVDRTKAKFFRMASFPNVIGCIDCTHVSIIGPSINEHEFINRKGVHSINVQSVCNADMHITNTEVKWPGKRLKLNVNTLYQQFPQIDQFLLYCEITYVLLFRLHLTHLVKEFCLLDGTFHAVSEPFIQLLSIQFHQVWDEMKQVPLCFVLMTRQ